MNKKRIFLSAALLTLALNALVLMLRGPEGSSASIALGCTADDYSRRRTRDTRPFGWTGVPTGRRRNSG